MAPPWRLCMTRDEKFKLRRRTTRWELWNRVAEIPNLPIKAALLAVYLLGAVYVQGKQEAADAFMETLILPAPLPEAICDNLLLSYLLAGVIVFGVLLIYLFDPRYSASGCQPDSQSDPYKPRMPYLRQSRQHPFPDHPGQHSGSRPDFQRGERPVPAP